MLTKLQVVGAYGAVGVVFGTIGLGAAGLFVFGIPVGTVAGGLIGIVVGLMAWYVAG